MTMIRPLAHLLAVLFCCLTVVSCTGLRERQIEFVYMALGASDATGVGAVPLTEGYVYQIRRELDRRMSGVFLINLGVPGARIDLIKEQVRVARQMGTRVDLVTVWTGANDLVNGDDPKIFQEDLRAILTMVTQTISGTVVIANLPDLTKLPRFRDNPSPSVTALRIATFNKVIEEEAQRFDASLVDLSAYPVHADLVFDADGFHPNNEGHRDIANQFLRVILPLLNMR
jgi:acyl-CoA thioesterase I